MENIVNPNVKCFRTKGGLVMAQLDDKSFENKEIRIVPNLEHPCYKSIGLKEDYLILGFPNWESGLYLKELFETLNNHYREISRVSMALNDHQECIFKSSDKSQIKENLDWYDGLYLSDDEEEDFFPSKNSKNHFMHFSFRKKGMVYMEDLLSENDEGPLFFINRDLIGVEIFPIELNISEDNWLVPYTEEDIELMNKIDYEGADFTFIPSIYSSFKIKEHRFLLSDKNKSLSVYRSTDK